MNPAYALSDVASVFSPSLVFFPELIPCQEYRA